jgi:hypothetical protein
MNNTNETGPVPVKNWTSQHPVATTFISIVCILLVLWMFDSDQDQPTPQSSQTLSVGEEGILNNHTNVSDCSGTMVLAVDEEAHEAMIKAALASDNQGLAELIASGRAYSVPTCSRVKVIDQNFGSRQIRLVDTGETGWVSMEFVKK